MLNEIQVLALINNISSINMFTQKKGFSNIRLFRPLQEHFSHQLHFIVEIKNKDVSSWEKAELNAYLRNLLNFEEIVVLTENELDEEGKREVIGEQIPLKSQFVTQLKEFFQNKSKHILKAENPVTNLNSIPQVEVEQKAVAISVNISLPITCMNLEENNLQILLNENFEQAKQKILEMYHKLNLYSSPTLFRTSITKPS